MSLGDPKPESTNLLDLIDFFSKGKLGSVAVADRQLLDQPLKLVSGERGNGSVFHTGSVKVQSTVAVD